MKLASTIARYLLGLIFTVMGLNGLLHFIPMPPPSSPLVIQYLTAVSVSHYIAVIFLLQVFAGILLFANRFVPLALTILAAILVNILLFHITMDPKGIGLGAFATILWILIYVRHQAAFRPLLTAT